MLTLKVTISNSAKLRRILERSKRKRFRMLEKNKAYLALSKERRCSAHTVLEMIPDYEIQKKVDL